ncbi:MAG: cysteine--tRNA ligase, partial [Gammaproteobacteria bacterium]|nr:cysteine--tRNA ligase [Gammaproteobacteria bacterium]
MSLVLHNTRTRQKEAFVPLRDGEVTMYVCGPTVYSFPHIGNARPAVVFDVLARLLRTRYRVTYARNITDIDDKINKAAADQRVPIGDITRRFEAVYLEDMGALGVAPPDLAPHATDHVPAIIAMIGRLIAGGHAYAAEGHVLFRVQSFPDYGALSGRDRRELLAGARVEVAPYKEDAGDFVLWKPSTPDLPGWDSPWGRGRPGWHIECSAMIGEHLGPTIDIHGGGNDLIFPHHENEVAQSTCAHGGALFVRYWLHNGFVNVDHTKMSKSLGNVLLVRDLLKEAPGEAIRLALLSAHYRQPLDWTADVLPEARRKLDRLYGALREAPGPAGAPDPEFIAALDDDLNTPKALAVLFDLARQLNKAAGPGERQALAARLRASGQLLGLLREDPDAWLRGAAETDGPT